MTASPFATELIEPNALVEFVPPEWDTHFKAQKKSTRSLRQRDHGSSQSSEFQPQSGRLGTFQDVHRGAAPFELIAAPRVDPERRQHEIA
jgi:hypothetical protein